MKKMLFILLGCFILASCTNEQEAQTMYKEAVALKQKQNYSEAIEKYKELIQKYPWSSISSAATKEKTFCEEEIKKQKDKERLKLFSGYKNIQFGMDKSQVKKLFDGKLIQSREKYLVYVKDKAEITFWFFHNALEQIVVEPNARKEQRGRRSALEDIQNTLAALVLKYGEFEEIPNMVSVIGGYVEVPIKYYRWGFKDREVVFTHWDYATGYSFVDIEGYQSVKIKYRDLGLKQQKEQEEAKQQMQKQLQAIHQKQQELNNIL
ncbi:MAG: hypothetical protein II972_03585 [Elusimicrobiaceae bacterium]|nr:hypothetical protein [Elusimicrobiaceae bacterium]